MTSRERVLTTLEHREPDRVPGDFGSTVDTSITYLAYQNLLRHLGKEHLLRDETEAAYMDLACGVVQVDQEVLEDLGIDCRGLVPSASPGWKGNVSPEGRDLVISDAFGAKWFRPPGGYYFDQREGSFPLAGLNSLVDIEAFTWPDLAGDGLIRGLRDRILALGPDCAVAVGDPVGGIFAAGFRTRGYMRFYLDLGANPALAASLMDKFTDLKIQYWEKILAEVGDLINVVVFEDDLGQQDRPLISPDMYRQLIKPRHKRLFAFVKERMPDSAYLLLHSDGSIYSLIPDLIEIGVDILNPLQVNAAGMDSRRLKKEFGRDLVFWGGGVDTQGVLSFGTPQEVRDEVRRRIDDLAPGGGFVFSTIHNIQPEVPPANLTAMWQTWQEYGRY